MIALREALQDADTRHVALGHFNGSDLSGFRAVVRVGRRWNLPPTIGVSEGGREFIEVKETALPVRTVPPRYWMTWPTGLKAMGRGVGLLRVSECRRIGQPGRRSVGRSNRILPPFASRH